MPCPYGVLAVADKDGSIFLDIRRDRGYIFRGWQAVVEGTGYGLRVAEDDRQPVTRNSLNRR